MVKEVVAGAESASAHARVLETITGNVTTDKADGIEVHTSFGSGIINVQGNAYGDDEVEIERDESDELLLKLELTP